jgi:hypothetical protein
MGQPDKHDIPAAGHNLLLPLYDPLLRLLDRAKHTHGRLIELAGISRPVSWNCCPSRAGTNHSPRLTGIANVNVESNPHLRT